MCVIQRRLATHRGRCAGCGEPTYVGQLLAFDPETGDGYCVNCDDAFRANVKPKQTLTLEQIEDGFLVA